MKKCLPLLLFSMLCICLNAQRVAIGEWRDHLNYSTVQHLAHAQNKIFAACDAGMFFVDLDDNSINRLSTTDGLREISVTALESNPSKSILFIGYGSGVMDVVEGTEITSVKDISRAQIIGNKQINHFNFLNDSTCYISTGFGILEYNVINKEVRETFLIGDQGKNIFVNSTFIANDTIYACTENGIYKAYIKSFLYDPSNWHKEISFPEPNANVSTGFAFGGKIHFNVKRKAFDSDTVYTQSLGMWVINDSLSAKSNYSFRVEDGNLLVANSTSYEVYNPSYSIVRRGFTSNDKGIQPRIAIYGPNDAIWVGDQDLGLIESRSTFDNTEYKFQGPVSNRTFRLRAFGDKIYSTGGAHTTSNSRELRPAEVSIFQNENWTLFGKNTTAGLDSMVDFISATQSPLKSSRFAVASMGAGVVIFDDNEIKNVYDFRNSPLTDVAGIATFVVGADYDQNGVLWVSNSESTEPLKALDPSGKWYSFKTGDGSPVITNEVLTTSWNHIWFIIPGKGIGVLDYNGTLSDINDDRYLELLPSINEGNLPGGRITTITEDADGQIWVGSLEGLRVFYNPRRIFESDNRDCRDILIQQDGQTKLLLDNQAVSEIFVDAANRKWISTLGNGVYLMSSDGTEEVLHFTQENSPLFTNSVSSVAVDGSTGEVFFATQLGIQTYRETATISGDFENIRVFPNPVPPRYDGVVGISGVADQAEIIITDIAGNKVYEAKSNGGQATWDVSDFNGNRVATGVYLIYATSSDGTTSGVAKILIEN